MSERREIWFGVILDLVIGFCAGFLAAGIGTARDAAIESSLRGRLHGEIAELRDQIEILKRRKVDQVDVREDGTSK